MAESSYISQLSGGTLLEDRIQLDAPNQLLTYRYTDGIAALDTSVSVTGENSWTVPLSMENWTYGQPAPSRWHSPPLAMCHSATDLPPGAVPA